MASITIVKFKVRRGANAQREAITLDQGELGYTTDTRRLFVGDGATAGGHVIGNKVLPKVFTNIVSLGPDSSPGMQLGDIGYVNSKLYMLTSTTYKDDLSGYAYIGNVPDNTYIEFDSNNKLTVKAASLDGSTFATAAFTGGLKLGADGTALDVDLNSDFLELSGPAGSVNSISPLQDSITQREINSNSFVRGLSGGNDELIGLNVDGSYFDFNAADKLILSDTRVKTITGSIDVGENSGISYNAFNELVATVRSVTSPLGLNDAGNISIAGGLSGFSQELPYLNFDRGLAQTNSSSIWGVITGIGLSGNDSSPTVPVGTILPHSNAFTSPPAGYVLCDGRDYPIGEEGSTYNDLYQVIGTRYGAKAGTTFSVPSLTGGGMPGMLYGYSADAPEFAAVWLSGGSAETENISLSGLGINYIIKYSATADNVNLFNGCPNQASAGLQSKYNQKTYKGLSYGGATVELSSAGFITFAHGGSVRNSASNETFDRFAIPVYSW
tara:strand:- start:7707 stop:9200 length:1494 start_codon:yes stop_codon:yes gene_type:complete